MPGAAIRYVTGDATRPRGYGRKVIAHIVNDAGKWGAGFVLALSRRWPEPEADYRAWFASGKCFTLGRVRAVAVDPYIRVANMIGQHGIYEDRGVPPIRYDAVWEALCAVADYAAERDATVHMPRIGTGLAGGSWNTIERLVKQTIIATGVDVTVYDLP